MRNRDIYMLFIFEIVRNREKISRFLTNIGIYIVIIVRIVISWFNLMWVCTTTIKKEQLQLNIIWKKINSFCQIEQIAQKMYNILVFTSYFVVYLSSPWWHRILKKAYLDFSDERVGLDDGGGVQMRLGHSRQATNIVCFQNKQHTHTQT